MPTKLFIIGTGRCGTHTLTRILETVPNTCSLHEGRGVIENRQIDVGDIKGLNMYLYHSFERKNALAESYSLSGQTLKIIDNNFLSRHHLISELSPKNIHFCEANRQLYNYINYIYKNYPDAKFIHLIRNGYDCVRSWYPRLGAYPERTSLYSTKFIKKTLRKGILNSFSSTVDKRRIERLSKKKDLDKQDIKLLCSKNPYYEYDKPLPYANDEWANEWESFGRVQKIAWFWQYTNNLISERLKKIPFDLSVTLRLEDISSEKIEEILRFAELPASFSLDRIKAYDKKDHSNFEWSKHKISQFNVIAGDCMENFGYKLRS